MGGRDAPVTLAPRSEWVFSSSPWPDIGCRSLAPRERIGCVEGGGQAVVAAGRRAAGPGRGECGAGEDRRCRRGPRLRGGGGTEQGSAVPCKDPRAAGAPRGPLGAPSGASGLWAGGRPRGVGAAAGSRGAAASRSAEARGPARMSADLRADAPGPASLGNGQCGPSPAATGPCLDRARTARRGQSGRAASCWHAPRRFGGPGRGVLLGSGRDGPRPNTSGSVHTAVR